MARSAIEGAGLNVKINLSGIKDSEFVKKMKAEVDNMISDANELQSKILEIVTSKIET